MHLDYKIGKFEGNAVRYRPNEDRISSFLRDNAPIWKDYDVYLWGSYPDKKETWDADFLVHAPKGMTTEEMEYISVNSLNNSLVKNNFLADIGFTDEENMYNFNQMIDRYNKTGEKTPTRGYIYGEKWYAGDKLFRDRTMLTEGVLEDIGDNMFKKTSYVPYPKMVNNLKENINYYKDKPILVSGRGNNGKLL